MKESRRTRSRREHGQMIVQSNNPHGYLTTSRKYLEHEKPKKAKGGIGTGIKSLLMTAALFMGLASVRSNTGKRGK